MTISDILTPARVLGELRAKSKEAVLEELAELLVADVPGLDAREIADVLRERERLNSTAIADGIAIPHGKFAGIDSLVAAFARSTGGADFDSSDRQPTRLFFVLVAPDDQSGANRHLRALARISRLLKTEALRERLLATSDPRALYEAIVAEDAKF